MEEECEVKSRKWSADRPITNSRLAPPPVPSPRTPVLCCTHFSNLIRHASALTPHTSLDSRHLQVPKQQPIRAARARDDHLFGVCYDRQSVRVDLAGVALLGGGYARFRLFFSSIYVPSCLSCTLHVLEAWTPTYHIHCTPPLSRGVCSA